MIIALAILLAVALAVCGWLAFALAGRSRALSLATGRAEELEREQADARNQAQALAAKAEAAETALDKAGSRAKLADQERLDLQRRLDQAESAQREAVDRATSAQTAADDASGRLAAAEAELGRLAADLEARDAAALAPTALWALELARSERTWRHSVSPGPQYPSPFGSTADPLRVAVETEVSALREDVGADILVDWQLDPGIGPEAAFPVLRWAQEVLAGAAMVADTAVLVVRAEGDDVLLTLEPTDGTTRFEVVIPAPAGAGVTPIENGIRVLGAAAPLNRQQAATA